MYDKGTPNSLHFNAFKHVSSSAKTHVVDWIFSNFDECFAGLFIGIFASFAFFFSEETFIIRSLSFLLCLCLLSRVDETGERLSPVRFPPQASEWLFLSLCRLLRLLRLYRRDEGNVSRLSNHPPLLPRTNGIRFSLLLIIIVVREKNDDAFLLLRILLCSAPSADPF